ncbi:helix-turn-helix transcriptional regulator [Catenulispora sp. NF23]|uniref:winged helix-turn-helix transcriptional regulator n=1 Tax=Catenulispora pinistramenti TaxID=2705254 RepID=UPI001BACE841|nr:helix-turn-helix domain-containing protein [Catenulispora pinistramenti]MBS2532020.1 helix-turn-helix transcriptional regulator [Catenulispora pinistramenti]
MVTIAAPRLVGRLRAERETRENREDGENGEPRGDLFDADCPTRLLLDRIGDKWTVLVVLLLSDGPMRFTELRTHLGRVAPKVLTQSLRRMERDGLLTRQVFAEVPPRVEYTLTGLGHSLAEPIAVIGDWAEVNMPRFTAARQAYDAAHDTAHDAAHNTAHPVVAGQ